MQLNQALKNVSVIGATGKMGSGIALLLLQEMARLEVQQSGTISGKNVLHLIDLKEELFPTLRYYLKTQLTKYAESNIVQLRSFYASNPFLISNQEIIYAFVEGALDLIRFGGDILQARDSFLVFEAIIEDVDAKVDLFKKLIANEQTAAYYFTNTSSIPVALLNEKCQMNDRVIGFHFYNPPVVQKLIEIIPARTTKQELIALAVELAERLRKTVVFSSDVAGFIGNNFLFEEVSFASEKVAELSKKRPDFEAIYIINQATQEYLLRPMGIFQLIDYIGIDVCHNIAAIIKEARKIPLKTDLIDKLFNSGILGGITPNGNQKNGFFKYSKGHPVAVYSLKDMKYVPIEGQWKEKADEELGLAKPKLSWKSLQKNPDRRTLSRQFLLDIMNGDTAGGELAKEFVRHSRKIAEDLVAAGIAKDLTDVDTVLETGFYHLYGPSVPWMEKLTEESLKKIKKGIGAPK